MQGTQGSVLTSRRWVGPQAPASILAIRLQALGDVTITLPYLRALKQLLPQTQIDLVTRREDVDLPRAVDVFGRVEALPGGRSERLQFLVMAPLVARLAARRYPVVIDLQNNRVSSTIRRVLAAKAWSVFDRVSPISAGERTRRAIEAAGFPLADVDFHLPLRDRELGLDRLRASGWKQGSSLVILSPSGAFQSRNWPLDHYVRFARLWQARHDVQFAILGLPAIASKARALSAALGGSLVDLVARTTVPEAMGIVQRASLVLTEDCGLMHMAWTSGVPTVALFGSSRHDWAAPQGAHTICLHSGDLECGACMDAICRYGDVHCLSRYSPERVVAEAERLLADS